MDNTESPLIAGRSMEEWDQKRIKIRGPFETMRALRHHSGLIFFLYRGEVVYICQGASRRGGLTPRYLQLCGKGDSGRKHYAGRLVYEHRDQLDIEVLLTGIGDEARELAKKLKTPMIRLHRPKWNAANAPFMRKG